jgi:hypothetical protein
MLLLMTDLPDALAAMLIGWGERLISGMIYHCIRYTIDPHKLADFEAYSRRWMEGGIIRRGGG